MHKLLERQLRAASRDKPDGEVDLGKLLATIDQTYAEFERERRLNDRAARLMEEELREANAQIERETQAIIHAVVANISEGVVITSEDGEIVTLNAAAERLFGLSAKEAAGRDIVMMINAPQVESGGIAEGKAITRDGNSISIEFSANDITTRGEGRKLWIIRDVSERKAREATLAAAIRAAESANRLKSQFLATMSHELRTPLNAILGFSEVIRDQTFGADAGARYIKYAADIHASGAHLLSLISDILDLSKIEAGSYKVHNESADLVAIAQHCASMIQGVAQKNQVTLETTLPKEARLVSGDKRALRQILINLLSNAVKFTPKGGRVTLSLGESEGHALLTVCDTGIGIERDHLPEIFEPFRQADSSISRKFEGTGLGLAITKRLVDLHAGKISIASTLGEGTIVRVMLPLSAAAGQIAAA